VQALKIMRHERATNDESFLWVRERASRPPDLGAALVYLWINYIMRP
jgi:hypothetical protein